MPGLQVLADSVSPELRGSRPPACCGGSWQPQPLRSMTGGGSMSSGYGSLEEELGDCFFTAKPYFFGKAQNKRSPTENGTKDVKQNPKEPPLQEIKQRIDAFNAKVTNCLVMKLSEDSTYTGFIKVHMKLCRPVTVPAGIRPQSIYDALKEVNPAKTTDKRTSFYLPLDAVRQLHISSTTTVAEVIQGLLKKFMVVDNPQKFALFKQETKDGQVRFQKLAITEHPLYLRLLAGPDTDVLSFVLKENETGEVEWDAFSIPELQNFLLILEREEKDKIKQVQKKFSSFKHQLQEALREAEGKPG